MPYLSVIIPTHNNQKTIPLCLAAIRSSAYTDYELIVVDDKSDDATVYIARSFADKVVELAEKKTRSQARNIGFRSSSGEVIVNIDSDIVIRPDTLAGIADFFTTHPDTDAATGLLAETHPHKDLFSQYKNLYMHYIFMLLPERVDFFFGSICAVRRKAFQEYESSSDIAEDTDLGQRLAAAGKRIAFLRDAEVVHLKKYTFSSFFANDLRIPAAWARLFVRHKGWRRMFKAGPTGFAHAPKLQIASIAAACALAALLIAHLAGCDTILAMFCVALLWSVLNSGFILYLARKRGIAFGLVSVLITFIDNLVMASGILVGLITCRIGHASG